MSRPPFAHGAPRARHDPIVTAADALAVVDLARSWPPREEIIAFLLDGALRGTGTILTVHHVHAPADVLVVAELMGGSGAHATMADGVEAASLVVASVRTAETSALDDIDLWQQMSELTDDLGIVLREWFVIGPSGCHCPRELLGEPDRWPR